MKDTNGAVVMARALEFLHQIKTPVPVTEFTSLELTGHPEADAHLVKVSLMMLAQLKGDGFINADDLNGADAQIYGLTTLGVEMYQMFQEIAQA